MLLLVKHNAHSQFEATMAAFAAVERAAIYAVLSAAVQGAFLCKKTIAFCHAGGDC